VNRLVMVMLFLCVMMTTAMAEPLPDSELPFRYLSWHISYDINEDGSYIEAQKWSGVILKEKALEQKKTAGITFSTSVAKGEILEAYTVKKSGQRIDAPKSSYQVTINDGYEKASPLFSDETSISVVFPDLAIGDTITLSSRITNSEGIFPNQFSIAHSFSPYATYDDVSIQITAPAAMPLKYKSYFLTEQKPVIKDGKQTLRWSFRNKAEKWEPSDAGIVSVGEFPSLYVSTFKSYKEISDAYGLRAMPKAAVTPRIRQLAGEIVLGKTSPETQANAIYDWVARNISYGGNCIGLGAVVPRDLDVVLDNKMGDCKDHATLLQALLAARKIESDQALVNATSLYELPAIPVVSAVNHVINFIPSLNLFVDSTAQYIPFGMLPVTLGEKPVLLVKNYQEGRKILPTAQYGHEQVMRSNIRINPDGSATGKTEVALKGLPGVGARVVMRNITRDQEDFVAKKMLESQGMHGSGTLAKDDPLPLLDSYKYSLEFKLDDFVTVGTATAMPVKPVVTSFFPIGYFLHGAYDPVPKKAHQCAGGSSIEEYILEFPENVKILSFPKDLTVSGTGIEYKASYRKSANILTVRREFKDKTVTNVCTPQYAAEYQKSMLPVAKDLKSQMLLGERGE